MAMKKRLNRKLTRGVLAGALVIGLLLAGLELSENEGSEGAAASGSEPAHVEAIPGRAVKWVVLAPSAAERLGLETGTVERRGSRKSVPYSAILYDEHGDTWVYTSPGRLRFVRAPITVAAIEGDVAFVAAGPPVGTSVATVGAAELFGTEFEVDH
jgi:hypothetical protein